MPGTRTAAPRVGRVPSPPLLLPRSPTSAATESDATYQRKLRQRQLQQRFREQMGKQQQEPPSGPPAEKQGPGPGCRVPSSTAGRADECNPRRLCTHFQGRPRPSLVTWFCPFSAAALPPVPPARTAASEPLTQTDVLPDSLEMWDMALDAGDGVVKPLSKPEPPQAPATSVLKNEMETWNRTPQSLCHQNPQAKAGPWHLQTYHLNQHITGSKVF
eukprot:bmy_06811T0